MGDTTTPSNGGPPAWGPSPTMGNGIRQETSHWSPPGGRESPWLRHLRTFIRLKWLILLVTCVGTGVGLLAARRAQPGYLAQGTIWIETESRMGPSGPLQTGQLLETYGWVELIKSYEVLDEVVHDLRLFIRPHGPEDVDAIASLDVDSVFRFGGYRLTVDEAGERYSLATDDGAVLEEGSVGDSIGGGLGFRWAPPPGSLRGSQTVEFTLVSPREAARQLNDNLWVRIDQGGSFLRMELGGTSPERLAATINAVAERYVEVAADLKRAKATDLLAILEEQVQQARENLEEAEISLENFRVSTITLPAERSTPLAPGLEVTRDPVFNRFFNRKLELEELRRDRRAIERVLDAAPDSGLSIELLETVPAVPMASQLLTAIGALSTKRAELRERRFRYTEEDPDVARLLREIRTLETEAIPEHARALAGALSAREAELEVEIADASTDLENIPPRVMEEARLQRRVEIAETLYETLQQRYEEARLSRVSSIPDVRILDRAAIPQEPVSQPGIRLALLGFLGSLGAALLGAVLLDRMDPRVRYPEDVTERMGLPVLGAVPHVRAGNGWRRRDNKAAVIEAFRSVRLNIVFAQGTSRPLVLAVSSPEGGSGKSFVSANLALSFAERQQKTLLIDADTRRGTQHRLLALDRKPGLTDYLDGSAGIEDVIKTTENPYLDVLPSGSRGGRTPLLLESRRMRKLMEEMRLCYETIIVDTPPIQAGTDATVLSTLAGDLVMVIRTGVTHRGLAETQLLSLDTPGIRILGVVLNDAPETGAYGYYAYPSDYVALEEDGSLPDHRLLKV